jgi:cytochrome c peroxidase
MPTILRWLLYIVGGFFALLLLLFIVAGLIPPETDPPVDMANHGAGSSSVQPSYTGLQRAFPDLNEPADNPTTPKKRNWAGCSFLTRFCQKITT